MIEINKHDARYLCAKELGVDVGTMDDGELVILHTDDLTDFSFQSGTVYFGDLVIEAFKSGDSVIQLQANSVNTVFIDGANGNEAVGSIIPCVIFNNVTGFDRLSAHFYGWKFTYTV